MSYYAPPMKPGQYTTDDGQSADVNKTYRLNDGVFKWVYNSAIISNAGGKTVLLTLVSGAPTGAVTEAAAAAAVNVAGVIPIGSSSTQGGAITATTELAANSYFLVQLSGEAQVKAANTTTISPYPLITTTTAGGVGSYSTVAAQVADVLSFLGYATNTVAATAAGQLITCVLTRVA